MIQSEYEQKKRERWEEFRTHVVCGTDNPKGWFERAFDRAFVLGKQTETISQEEIEKAADEYALSRQQAKHNAKKEEDATMRDFDKTLKAWDTYDIEQAYEDGANFALGKQEKDGIDLKKLNEMLDDTLKKETKDSLNQWLSKKDADTVTINKWEYYKLCKCSRYMANWVPYFDVCPICGEYNQRGCVCANCGNN